MCIFIGSIGPQKSSRATTSPPSARTSYASPTSARSYANYDNEFHRLQYFGQNRKTPSLHWRTAGHNTHRRIGHHSVMRTGVATHESIPIWWWSYESVAMSKEIIERQNGTIRAKNKHGGGAFFEIRFYSHWVVTFIWYTIHWRYIIIPGRYRYAGERSKTEWKF